MMTAPVISKRVVQTAAARGLSIAGVAHENGVSAASLYEFTEARTAFPRPKLRKAIANFLDIDEIEVTEQLIADARALGREVKQVVRTCPKCGQKKIYALSQYLTTDADLKEYSPTLCIDCYTAKLKAKNEPKTCHNCGNELERTPSWIRQNKSGLFFCDGDCWNAWRRERRRFPRAPNTKYKGGGRRKERSSRL